VAQTLFDGGLNRANLAYAAAQKKAAVASYEKAVQTAFREAADALALHGTVDDQVRAQQGLLGAAAASLRLSTLRYKSGSDAYVAVLIAQRTVYAAEQSLIQAELSREVNGVTLYAALGGGLHPGA
jgi:multidrug efflux system outer membrane protein